MSQRARLAVSLLCPLTLLILFICLATAVSVGDTLNLDLFIREGIHRWSSSTLTSIAFAVTFVGSILFLTVATAIALLGFYCAGWRRDAAVLGWLMGGAVVLNNALKYAFHRLRPEPFFGIAPESYAFPSGHALYSCCFYLALAGALSRHAQSGVMRAWIWLAALLLVMAVGLSRVYLGVHYPSDVLGGCIVALFWIGAVVFVDRVVALPKRHQ